MRLLRRLLGVDVEDAEPEMLQPLAPEQTVYVVGDVHGRADLFDQLLERIDLHRESVDGPSTLILVGDYVDRGEESASVLRRAQALANGGEAICLMGNHERMMLDFLDNPVDGGRRWLRHGGLQTLASFGVTGVTDIAPAAAMQDAAAALSNAMGPALEGWVRDLPLQWTTGNLVVTHAALDPDMPIDMQSEKAMLWGHPDFMRRSRRDGYWVAHGHVVVEMPQVAQGRISIDTGAVFGGRLTAAVLAPYHEPEFLQVA